MNPIRHPKLLIKSHVKKCVLLILHILTSAKDLVTIPGDDIIVAFTPRIPPRGSACKGRIHQIVNSARKTHVSTYISFLLMISCFKPN